MKHLERKTGEDVPYSDVARYLQDKLQGAHAAASSGRNSGAGLHSTGALVRLGSRVDMRSVNSKLDVTEGNSDDDAPRARRRRR